MKRIFLIGLCPLISSFAMAGKPAVLQPGEMLPAGAVIANPYQNQSYSQNSNMSEQFSLAAGYAGSKIGSDEFGGDERFNGAFLNASTALDAKVSLYTEYAYQEASDIDFNELSIGMLYRAFENNSAYAALGFGVGYAWLDESAYNINNGVNTSVELEYVTLPVNFEFGYKINPSVDLFGNVGYKWFFNRDAEACIGGACVSGNSSDLNIDGVTYKAGLRYNF